MSDLLKAVEYLRSYEADGHCKVLGVDSFGDRVVLGNCEYDFLVIVGAYVEQTFDIRITHSGPVGLEL